MQLDSDTLHLAQRILCLNLSLMARDGGKVIGTKRSERGEEEEMKENDTKYEGLVRYQNTKRR